MDSDTYDHDECSYLNRAKSARDDGMEKADEAISDLHMSGGLLNKRQMAEFVTRLLLSAGAYWDSDASPHARQLLYDNGRYYARPELDMPPA